MLGLYPRLMALVQQKDDKIRVVAQPPADTVTKIVSLSRFIQAQASSATVTDLHAQNLPVHIPCPVLQAIAQGCAMSSLHDLIRAFLACLCPTLFRAHRVRQAETRSQPPLHPGLRSRHMSVLFGRRAPVDSFE